MPFGLFKNKTLDKLRQDKNHKFNFLIIRNGLIGDTVFITPIVIKLSTYYKNSKIDLVLNPKSTQIFDNFPAVTNIFTLPKKFGVLQHILFFISLRKNKYDCVFIQELNTHYTIMSLLLKSRLIIGYKNSLSYLISFSVKRFGHAINAEQLLVNYILNINNIIPTTLFVSQEETYLAKELLQKKGVINKPIVAIQTTCSEPNSIRLLDINKVAKIADLLIENLDVQILFLGVKEDLDTVNQVQNLMKYNSFSVCGETNIRSLIAILKEVNLIIGPDTGTLHIANAVNTPVIMYMGYSVPEDTGPDTQNRKSIVIRANLDCIPCRYSNPKPKNWEYCKNNRPALCMKEIKEEDFVNSAKELLGLN